MKTESDVLFGTFWRSLIMQMGVGGLDLVIVMVPPGREKSWNLGRPFSRPGKSWKIAKVMENNGNDDNVMAFLLLH